jgi:hypothetical protein
MVKEDNAPGLRAFGPHAPRIARFLQYQPALGARLLCAPLRALHAVGVYLHLVETATDEEVARRLVEVGPRELLRFALPTAHPALYRVLDRCGDVVRSAQFYKALAEASAGPFAKVIFATAKTIDDAFLRHLAALSRGDEVIRALPTRLLADVSAVEAATSLIALLRGYGTDAESALAGLPAKAGAAGVRRRLLKMLADLTAPPVPTPLPPGMTRITSVRELREVGCKLDLCVQKAMNGGADYWLRLVSGESIFAVLDEPAALAELRAVAPGVWRLMDVREKSNRIISQARRRALFGDLAEAGWKIVPVDPVHALMTLGTRDDDDFREWNQTLAETLRELDHEWA